MLTAVAKRLAFCHFCICDNRKFQTVRPIFANFQTLCMYIHIYMTIHNRILDSEDALRFRF